MIDESVNQEQQEHTEAIKDKEGDGYFRYSEEFMLQLMAELVRNQDFARTVLRHLKPDYFRDRLLIKNILKVIKRHHSAYGTTPTTMVEFIDALNDEGNSDLRASFDKGEVAEQIAALYDSAFNTNPHITTKRVYHFIRYVKLKSAVLLAAQDCINHNFEKMQTRIPTAMQTTDFDDEPLDVILDKKWDAESQRTSLQGFAMNEFRAFCHNTRGIQPGMYVVGADTHTGKTNFVTNVALDLLQSNPMSKILWFSLDDNRNVAINRLLSSITVMPIPEVQHQQPTVERGQLLAAAYGELKQYAVDNRLWIYDIGKASTMAGIEGIIENKMHQDLVVVMDGLYNAEVDTNHKGILREENIKRANHVKKMADVYNIPIITTGELRKKQKKQEDFTPEISDIMESGKYAYNASCVILLYPESRITFELDPEYRVVAKFVKNKICGFIGEQNFIVKRYVAKMWEA